MALAALDIADANPPGLPGGWEMSQKQRDNWRDAARASFNQRGVHDHLRRLQTDLDGRVIQKVCPAVKFLPTPMPLPGGPWPKSDPAPPKDDYFHLKPIPGSVTLFWSRPGEPLLKQIEAAYASGNAKRQAELSESLQEELDGREVRSIEAAVDGLMKEENVFHFRYGSKLLAPNLGLVDNIRIASLTFPYNGGPLDSSLFEIVEFKRKIESPSYDYFVVQVAPELSDLEHRVLEAVPANMTEINIGPSAAYVYPVIAIVTAVVVATAVVDCASFQPDIQRFGPGLSDDFVREVGMIRSASALLQRRRQLFDRHFI